MNFPGPEGAQEVGSNLAGTAHVRLRDVEGDFYTRKKNKFFFNRNRKRSVKFHV